MSPEKIATIRRMWLEGATYREISDAVAYSARTIEAVRLRLNLPARNVGHFVRARQNAIPRYERSCLCCGSKFRSENKATNRVCDGCKSTRRWRSVQDYCIAMGGD